MTKASDIILAARRAQNGDSKPPDRVIMACRNAILVHPSEHTRRAYIHDLDFFVRSISYGSNQGEAHVLLNLPRMFRREHAIAYRDLLRSSLSSRGRPLSDGTVNRRLAVMSAIFREFMREGLVATNPFKGLTAGYRCDPTPALSNEERQRLLDAPDFEAAKTRSERQRRLRDKCLLALLFVHGIRQQEARLVRTTDLGTNQGYYTITVKQKRNLTIVHRLHPKLHHYIELYRGEFMDGDGYVFTGLARNGNSAPGRPLSPQAIGYIVERWAEVAGIKQRVTPHVGRATVITQALKKAPLQVVARSIGHASIESTARYDRNRNRMDQAIMTYQDCEL